MVGARSTKLIALMVALSLLCSGCLPSAMTEQPPVRVPEAFSEAGESVLPQFWWQSFADPSLDHLVSRALAENFSLKAARDRLDQAAAIAEKAGAERVPALNLETSAARIWSDTQGDSATRNSFSAGFLASYELDLWGRVRSGYEAAGLDYLARAEDLKTAGISLSAQVARTWYLWLEQKGQSALLAEQLEINTKILELVTLQFRTGQVGIGDVLQQRQLVEAVKGELALVAARVRVAANQLDILVGEAPGGFAAEPAGPLATLPPLPSTGVPLELLQRRPDVRSAWYRLRAADKRIAAAVADRFPRISLSGRVDSSAGQVEDLFQDWLSSVAANLVGPLIDGGRRRAEVDRARAAAAEALNDYGQVMLAALGEVEDALVRERQQKEHLASLERQLHLAELAEATLRDRYLQGAVDFQRALTAQLATQSLQRRQLAARQELIGYRIDLCRALAGGWE